MGEGWKDRVEETGTEERVGLCGGDGYLEDGLIGDLRSSRVWRKAGTYKDAGAWTRNLRSTGSWRISYRRCRERGRWSPLMFLSRYQLPHASLRMMQGSLGWNCQFRCIDSKSFQKF